MRWVRTFAAVIALAGFGAAEASAQGRTTKAAATAEAFRLPLEFYAGGGHARTFFALTPGGEVAVGAHGLTLRLAARHGHGRRAIVMRLAHAAPVAPVGARRLPGVMNVYSGSNPHAWRTLLATFSSILQKNVWPGIDAVYEGRTSHLEYDYLLAAGADPRAISLAFSGMDRIWVGSRGDLVLSAGGARVRERAPRAWRIVGGRRVAVSIRWRLGRHGRASFELGSYDRSRRLVIDPQLQYSTNTGFGGVSGVSVGGDNSVYIVGVTGNGYYVQHMAANGSGAEFTSQFSGAEGLRIATDSTGHSFVTGTATSSYTTTANAYESASAEPSGGAPPPTAPFATELNPNGGMMSSTLLGKGSSGEGTGIALDSAGDAYISITATNSETLPITPGTAGGNASGFSQQAALVKVNLSGSGAGQIVWGTYVEPGAYSLASGVAVDSAGEPVVIGWDSLVFSLGSGVGPPPSLPGGGETPQNPNGGGGGQGADAFVIKFNTSGTKELFRTTGFASTGFVLLYGVTVDPTGAIDVAGTAVPNAMYTNGETLSSGCGAGLPYGYTSAYYCAYAGKLSSTGTLEWSHIFPSTDDGGYAVAGDASGDVFVTGSTGSDALPTTAGSLQPQRAGGTDAFLSELDPTGTSLMYSTYYGGPDDDDGNSIGLASDGDVIIGGNSSGSFPTTAGAENRSGQYGFVVKLTPANTPVATTLAATSVTTTTATLNGNTDPRGGIDATFFEYGTTTAYGSQTSPQFWTGPTTVSQEISNLTPGTTYHYRLVADHYGIESDGADETFTTQSAGYTGPVITQSPQNVTVVAGQPVTLTAEATAAGQTPLRRWQESTDGGANFSQLDIGDGVQCVSSAGGTTTDDTTLSLEADNTGSCAAGATASYGTGLGLPVTLADNGLEFEVSFETPDGQTVTSNPATLTVIAPPTTTTTAPGALTATTADFNGTINPNGSATTYHFEYGTSTSYGSSTQSLPAGAGRTAAQVTTGVSGLQPDTTYYYRLVTSNQAGPGNGNAQSFKTPPAPSAPAVDTSTVSGLTGTTARLNGSVNPGALDTKYEFKYGPTSSYGSTTPTSDAGAGTSAVPVSANLTGLTPGTVYHYALVAINLQGQPTTADATFTTPSSGGGGTPPGGGTGTPPGGGTTPPGGVGKPTAVKIAILSSHARATNGRPSIELSCAGPSGSVCKGTVTLTDRVRSRTRPHTKATWHTIVLGSARFTIKAGRRAAVSIRLKGLTSQLLARARHHRLTLSVTVTDAAARPEAVKRGLTLTYARSH